MKQIRHLFLVIAFGMGFLTAPRAQVTYFGVNSSNATTGIMNLTTTELNDSILTSPNTLAVGSNPFNYATVYFVPTNTNNYKSKNKFGAKKTFTPKPKNEDCEFIDD